MPQVELVRKGYLPFAKMRVEIAGQVYFLTGGKKQAIELPQGEHKIKLGLEGWYKTSKVEIADSSSSVIIKPFIADVFYLVAVVLGILFFYFDHLGLTYRIILGTAFLLHVITIFYYTILKSDRYFSCLVV